LASVDVVLDPGEAVMTIVTCSHMSDASLQRAIGDDVLYRPEPAPRVRADALVVHERDRGRLASLAADGCPVVVYGSRLADLGWTIAAENRHRAWPIAPAAVPVLRASAARRRPRGRAVTGGLARRRFRRTS
jgi:hypothetical protein